MSAAPERLRIAFFAHNYPPHTGGLEVMVQSIATRLARRHDVVVVTSAWEGASGIAHEDGVEVHRLPALRVAERVGVPYPVPRGPGVRDAFAAARGAHVVHAHGALYVHTALGRRAARAARAPLVLTEHVGFVPYDSAAINAVQRAAWRLVGDPAVRGAEAVTACNGRVHAWLTERLRRPVHLVPNGVDLERFRPRSPEERGRLRASFGLPAHETLALFAGRVSAKKNLDVVLRVPRDAFTLVVCGGRRGLTGERLIDLGELPHERMADLMACADILVHAASGEGFPLAVLEAAAGGVPIVLLWDPGYGGLMPRSLVAAADTLDDVGPTLAALASDPARRAAMSAASRSWAEQGCSWEAAVASYEEIYRDVIEHAHVR